MSLLDTTGNCDSGSMGLSWGLQLEELTPKKKNRWLFSVPDIVVGQAPALPPKKAARPGIQMKEYEFQHLHESIWYPLKGMWKPIQITLFDIRCNQNVIFDWLATIYDPSQPDDEVVFNPVLEPLSGDVPFKVPECTLELYDGCGNVMETWTFENAYPSDITWGELDMDSSELVLVDFTLRYDRAWFVAD